MTSQPTIPPLPVLRMAEPMLPAPKQARSIEKRKRLLNSARVLFGKKGYEAASIAEITARAGTASGAFYQYFTSKKQILVVLMQEFLHRLNRLDLRPKPAANLRIGLRDSLTGAFRVDTDYFGVVRAWREAALIHPELERMERQIERWTNARVLGLLLRLQRHPQALGGRNLAPFAQMMDRHFWSLLARGARLSPAELDREVALAADVIYHYLFCDSPAEGEAKVDVSQD